VRLGGGGGGGVGGGGGEGRMSVFEKIYSII